MTAPSFPPGLPKLAPNAPELTPDQRAWVNSLLPHQRAEAERYCRYYSAILKPQSVTAEAEASFVGRGSHSSPASDHAAGPRSSDGLGNPKTEQRSEAA